MPTTTRWSPATAPLTGVDNITGARRGDLYVAEDGGNMEINIITPDGVVAPFLRVNGQGRSEITGPAFTPDGTPALLLLPARHDRHHVGRDHLRGHGAVPGLTASIRNRSECATNGPRSVMRSCSAASRPR